MQKFRREHYFTNSDKKGRDEHLTRWPFHKFTAKVLRTIDGSAWPNPAYIDLRPHGASTTMKMATFHPPRLIIERGSGNSVGVLFTETEWFEATRIGDEIALRIPLAEYEQANALLLAKRDMPKHTRKRITNKVRGIFGRRGKARQDSRDNKIEQLERQILKLEDVNRRLRARGSGAVADIAAIGILPGIVPPTHLYNINSLKEGFDAVSIYVTDQKRLHIDFIEGNAIGQDNNPAYTQTQQAWVQCLQAASVTVRVLELIHNRDDPYTPFHWQIKSYEN